MDSANFRGALLMMVAMAAFTCNDALTKHVSAAIGSGQTMLVRGVFTILLLGSLAWWQGALNGFARYVRPMILLRTVFEMAGTATFFIGLSHMPLATVSAIYQSLPLAVTVGAALFLGEQVGWRRWSAILVGLLGVMLILKPGPDGFDIYSIWMVVSVLFSAARDIVTRRITPGTPVAGIAAVTSMAVSAMGAAMMQVEGGWQPLSSTQLAALFGAAILLAIAYQTLIAAMQVGEVSFVAPFRYVSLVIAIAIGVTMFGERPDALMLLGAAIVVASGLYTLYRERVRKGLPVAAEASPRPGYTPLADTTEAGR